MWIKCPARCFYINAFHIGRRHIFIFHYSFIFEGKCTNIMQFFPWITFYKKFFPYTDKWRTLQEKNMSIHMKYQAPSMRHGHLIIIIIVVVNGNETHSISNISWRTQRRRNQYLTDLFSLIINVELLMEVIHGIKKRLHTIYVK